jgi:hypothetical protein
MSSSGHRKPTRECTAKESSVCGIFAVVQPTDVRATAEETVRPLISVPRRMGRGPGTGDAVPFGHAVRRKGGAKDAEEEGSEEDSKEEVDVGRKDQARE